MWTLSKERMPSLARYFLQRIRIIALLRVTHLIAFGVLACALPILIRAATCDNGASVDSLERCLFIKHYNSDDTLADPRVARVLRLAKGEYARSIALIVAISEYKHPEFDVPAAKIDAQRLAKFLVDDQQFDEVILLNDGEATIENIRYFLRTYAYERAAFYRGKVRFLFAFSGHGVPLPTVSNSADVMHVTPSVGLALASAADDRDLKNIYGLNELRPLFADLAKNVFHFLALINACYGGDIFGLALGGGDPNDFESPSSFGITAGPADDKVISLGSGHGSLFFDTLITGVESGDADPEARKVTLGLVPTPRDLYGIVRLGTLDSYISTEIKRALDSGVSPADSPRGNDHHWSGPIVPDGTRNLGGFFFMQHPPSANVHVTQPLVGSVSTFVTSLKVGRFFAPSLNQITIPQGRDDGFAMLRKTGALKRGIDVSHFQGEIDWSRVATANIQFAYIKATDAGSRVDPRFQSNWNGAKAAKLFRGAYHVYDFCESTEAQLANIRRTVPIEKDSLPIAIDIEFYDGQSSATIATLSREGQCVEKLGKEAVRRNLALLIEGLNATYGKNPIFYGKDHLINEILGTELATRIPLWKSRPGVKQAPEPPWSLWQFSDNETVDGVPVRVDLNVLSQSKVTSPVEPSKTEMITRNWIHPGLNVGCNETNSGKLEASVDLDPQYDETVVSAVASLRDTNNVKDQTGPTVDTAAGPTVIVSYGFKGLDRDFVGNCPGGGHATLVVTFTIQRKIPAGSK